MTATDTELSTAARLCASWAFAGARPERLAGGLINHTFAVWQGDEPVAVLQQLHPVFGAEVNLDIEALTAHLQARGLPTPRLLRTRAGQAWVEHEGRIWRALTWIDGRSVGRVPDPSWAEAGGELVGRFHRAVADFQHDYHFTRGNVHDTPRYLRRLRELLAPDARHGPGAVDERAVDERADERAIVDVQLADARELARQLLAEPLPELPSVGTRHCHGDLKISNLMFFAGPLVRGHCLVDLDTISRGTIAFELGDAMRSWCNPCGEDQDDVELEIPVFAAAMRGYRGVADGLLSDAERLSIAVGLRTVCVELAARFCIDAFEDRYFGWNPARYPSRRAHNLVRARGQLALGRSVARKFDALVELACGPLR